MISVALAHIINRKKKHIRDVVHGMYFTEKPNNLLSRTVDSERFENKVVQYFEVDLCDGRISTRGERVDKFLERCLCDDDLINYNLISIWYKG